LNPKPLFQCIAIPTPLYFFQVTWSGPKLFFDPLRLVLYFPGLMRARRLRRHRHRMSDWSHGSRWSCWSHRSSPLSSYYIFQAGGAPSQPWQKRLFVPGDLDPQLLPVSYLFVPG